MTNPASIPDLVIGDLRFSPPIIQGGMGVRISGPNLASAVSNEGALGVIAAVGTGEEMTDRNLSYLERSRVSLREMLRDTKKRTSNPIGINIMCALRNYADLVQVAEEEGVDVIISGAGLPLKLPGMISDPHIKLIPIVSSGKAADLICRTWKKRHNRLPDAMVVEGPRAGGHLGFKLEDLDGNPAHDLDILVKDVLEVAAKHGGDKPIPVIAAGGVFDGKDIAHFLAIGASGVQMGTRFVCTHECDASDAYKQAYIDSREEDIMLIESPLGLPLRVIRNKFIDAMLSGEKEAFKCSYRCLLACDPIESNYCIAKALLNAYRGNMEHGFAISGANAYRINKLVSVHELIEELVRGCQEHIQVPSALAP